MNTTQTLQQMQELRLQGMYQSYRSQLELPMDQQLEGHDLVAQLVQSEQLNRSNEKTAYYLKLAKLRLPATTLEADCDPERLAQVLRILIDLSPQGRPVDRADLEAALVEAGLSGGCLPKAGGSGREKIPPVATSACCAGGPSVSRLHRDPAPPASPVEDTAPVAQNKTAAL